MDRRTTLQVNVKRSKMRVGAQNLACSLLLLIAATFVVHPFPLRAREPIDVETLQMAHRMAMREWTNALPRRIARNPSESHMPSGAIGTIDWFPGVVGIVSYDLLNANPDREADILVYVNNILIPSMYARRHQFVCAYTELYYGLGKRWISLQGLIDRYPDPYVAIAYFITPTLDYLRKKEFVLSQVMLRELDRTARFAPAGSFWLRNESMSVHLPCTALVEPGEAAFTARL